jgi:dihydrofolate reductase
MIDLSIVVAMSQKCIIGNGGELPWKRLPSDLARFKRITMKSGIVIMGRTTYESILVRNATPLPGRKHIVLTRKCICSCHESVRFVGSVEKALQEVIANGGRACIIGGGEIFRLFLPLSQVTKMYITRVHAKLHGDVTFPAMIPTANAYWRCVDTSERCKRDPNDEYYTSFELYKRFRK